MYTGQKIDRYRQELRSFHRIDGSPYYINLFHVNGELDILDMDELVSFAKFLFGQDYFDNYDALKASIENTRGKRFNQEELFKQDETKRDSGLFDVRSFSRKLEFYCQNNFQSKSKICFCYLASLMIIEETFARYNPNPNNFSQHRIEGDIRDYKIEVSDFVQQYYSAEAKPIFDHFRISYTGIKPITTSNPEVNIADYGFAIYLILVTHGIEIGKSKRGPTNHKAGQDNKKRYKELCRLISVSEKPLNQNLVYTHLIEFEKTSNEDINSATNFFLNTFKQDDKVCRDYKDETLQRYVNNIFGLQVKRTDPNLKSDSFILECGRVYPELKDLLDILIRDPKRYLPFNK